MQHGRFLVEDLVINSDSVGFWAWRLDGEVM